MSEDPKESSGVAPVQERMRSLGLRPDLMWSPDINAPAFAAEAQRESRRIAESANENDDQTFIDALTTDMGWA